MTALYSWIAKIVGVLLIFLGVWLWGDHHGGKRIQTAWDVDKAAQVAALAKAQYAVIDAQNKAQEVSRTITVNYEAKLKDSAAASAALSALVLRYAAKIRGLSVPTVPNPTGSPAPAPEVTAGDGSVDAAASSAIAACGSDAAQLQALIDWHAAIAH